MVRNGAPMVPGLVSAPSLLTKNEVAISPSIPSQFESTILISGTSTDAVQPDATSVKTAETLLAAVIDTLHAPVPVHAPPHPAKNDPAAGVAVRFTDAPAM